MMSGDAASARDIRRSGLSAALSDGDLRLAARLSLQGLDSHPGDPDLLRLLLLTQLGLREVDTAQRTADRLSEAPLTEDALDALVPAYLAADRVAQARDVVARAAREETAKPWALEAARARIAMHLEDLAAARAILVRGIEREPDAPLLRSLMAEVLMADGGAAQAREVISRLGEPPSAPGPEAAHSDSPVRRERQIRD
jgi:predicted Zn-dependent protease